MRNMGGGFRVIAGVVFLATGVAGLAGVARAQSAAPAPSTATADTALEEVVVTARQRSEKYLDVPVTESAFTAADIKAAGIERPQDFLALTPGVSFVKTAEAGDLQVSIRGLNTARDAEPNFAFVVDGVLQTNPYALSQELSNINQIQVVKGPQGALYGRNAVAGAIIIDTRKPTDEFEADGLVSGANHGTYRATGWISGQLLPGVDAGLNAYYTHTNGFYSNSFLGCDNCVDFLTEYGATPRIIFKLGESGTVDVKAKYSHVSSGAINFNAATSLLVPTGPGTFLTLPAFYQDYNEHPFAYINDVVPQNVQVNKEFSVKTDWTLDFGSLTAWYSFNDQSNFFLTDGASTGFALYAFTPWCHQDTVNQVGGNLFYAPFSYASGLLPPYDPGRCGGYQYQQRDQIDNSIEIRLTSPGDQPLRWLGGVYAADIKRHVAVTQGADEGKGFVDSAFVPSTGPNPTDQEYNDVFKSRVGAAFGQVSYDILTNLEGAVALRYDYEHRTVDNYVPNTAPQTPGFGSAFLGAPVCPGPLCYINPYYVLNPTATSIPSRSANFSEPEPKVTLNWKFEPDWAAFASWGVGFRSGGFNSSGSAATIAENFGSLYYLDPKTNLPTSTLSISGVSDEYKKEVSKASEIGVKGELLDRTLFLSADYYYTRVDNMQYFNFFVGTFGLLRVVTNIDEATLQGFEGSARWRATPWLTLFTGYANVTSKIDAYAGRPYTVGNHVPYAPEYTVNAGLDLNVPLGAGDLSFVGRVDGEGTGRTWFSPVQNNTVQNAFGFLGNFNDSSRNPYGLMNVRVGLASKAWDVTAWGRNVLNKEYLAEIIPAPEFGGAFLHQGLGRAFGIDVAAHFNGR